MEKVMKAEVYSKDFCPFCVKAKHLLEMKGIEITEIDAVANREQLIERVTADTGDAPRTVPQIYLDGKHIGGYDQLTAYFAKLDYETDDGA
jgi:glutaredoxin 3